MIKNLNKILVEWAYRTHDGKPNPKSMTHQIILSDILREYGWPLDARIEMVNNLMEAPNDKEPPLSDEDKEEAKRLGLVWKGQGYGKENEKGITHKNVGGKLTKVDKDKDVTDKDKVDKPGDITKDPNAFKRNLGGDDNIEKSVGDKKQKDSGKIKDTEAVETKLAEKYKSKMNLAFDENIEEHGRVQNLMNKLFDGNSLDDDEKSFLSNWIRVVEPTEGSKNPKYAFYLARKEGHFSRSKKPAAIKIPPKKQASASKDAKNLHSWMQKNGIATQRTSIFGGKKTTANQMYVDADGKTKLLGSKDKPAATVQRDGDNPPKSITIGEQLISRQNDEEPGINSEEAKRRRRHNRNLDEYAKAIEGGTLDFIDMNDGVAPDSPENRVTVIKFAISGMVKQMNKLASAPIAGQPAPPIDNDSQRILNEIDEFSKRDPNENPQVWMKDFDALMSKFSNDDLLKQAWANYAEVYTAIRDMHDNGSGTENGACVLLPESTTLETVDTIVISKRAEGERKIVTLDGVSVKKGVGGASALTSKVQKSIFKPVGDIPKDKVKQNVLSMSKAHDAIYSLDLDENIQEHLDYHNQYRMEMKEMAKKAGISEDYIEKIEDESTGSKVESALNNIMSERSKAGLSSDSETRRKIQQRLSSYYMYTYLSHMAYNKNVDVQDFSNDSVTSQEGDKGYGKGTKEKAMRGEGTVTIDSSDGVDILAYPQPEYNIGFGMDGRSNNPGAGRFKNKPKSK